MRRIHRRLEHWIAIGSLVRDRVRARILALRGATVGRKVRLGAGFKVERPWCLKVGTAFHAEGGVYLKIVSEDARLEFGDSVFVGRGSEFDVLEKVSVGDHTVIAPGCFITDHNHGTSPNRRIDQQPCISSAIEIGRDVWLGTNVVVVAGIKIGDGAVVAANAVVTRDVPPMAIVAGVPATLLSYRDGSTRDGLQAPVFERTTSRLSGVS
jgi:acetyltransferase-like isoleucine patch superfamily enzyme